MDFSILRKGDYVLPQTLEEITGKQIGTAEYTLACLAIKYQIAAAIKARDGRQVTIRSEAGGLRILTDSEAAEYNPKAIEQSRRRLIAAHERNLDVDEAKLFGDERQSHYRNLAVGGAYVQHLKRARRELRIEGHKRKTPGIS